MESKADRQCKILGEGGAEKARDKSQASGGQQYRGV